MAKKFSIDTIENPVDVESIINSRKTAYINSFVKNDIDVIREIPISEIDGFPDHPFKVFDNEDMESLVESIKNNGVLTPITVRVKADGRYELISGHRRKRAAELAGLATIPAIISQMTEEEATIAMVDANLQREKILPSEKAFAYKMKLEAMKRQGKRTSSTSVQLAQKLSRDVIGAASGESGDKVRRYIRLTYLVPELLDKVDSEELPFMVAVDISYLAIEKQYAVLDYIKKGKVPNLKQSAELKQLGNLGMLNADAIYRVFNPYRVPRESVGLKSVPPENASNTSTPTVVLKSVPPATDSSSQTEESLQLKFVPPKNEAVRESSAPFMQLDIDGSEVPPQTKKEEIRELLSELKKKHGASDIPNWTGENNQVMKGYIFKAFDLWNKQNPAEQIPKAVLDNLLSALRWATDDMTAEEAYRYYEKR